MTGTNPRVAPDLVRRRAPKLADLTDDGLTADELAEAITHLAFYAGWPAAMSATAILAQVTEASTDTPPPTDHQPR
ncbi:carboxymuconolactone decarboxylase family protein [Actinospica robiniae]|uniref:carboxymuconolactone decarboxylase family protein n=1 Tax=Actinospica robiniae TaxID=304901 RepID=UPI0003FC9977|nr:carboxymuconolactone decarboxylase family protein [Actinospica robiniae]